VSVLLAKTFRSSTFRLALISIAIFGACGVLAQFGDDECWQSSLAARRARELSHRSRPLRCPTSLRSPRGPRRVLIAGAVTKSGTRGNLSAFVFCNHPLELARAGVETVFIQSRGDGCAPAQ
jgi:hypothetical protein